MVEQGSETSRLTLRKSSSLRANDKRSLEDKENAVVRINVRKDNNSLGGSSQSRL